MMLMETCHFIDEGAIADALQGADAGDPGAVRAVLTQARAMQGLSPAQVATLMAVEDQDLLEELFAAARWVKDEIYGSRLVLFAPLYISNFCRNECSYCAFRVRNQEVVRRALTQEEIAREVEQLVGQGHKRVLLVAGESYPAPEGFDYILKAIDTVYATRKGPGEIRRVNVNLAPLSVDEFAQLKARDIGTYQLFQETYHRPTYRQVHLVGKKRDYDWRVTAPDRAMEAGISDVGIGVLYGLADWRFDTLALLQHIAHLEETFGVGPHTISVPRLEPAVGSPCAARPAHPVSDRDFLKLVAILRLAVPYTGLIMSTRESSTMRRDTLALGVSQISAGSRTNPGGYSELGEEDREAQFQLGDHRALDEVVRDVAELGYIPSFCTGCYRLGRTGQDFMDLAKPGAIKAHCAPNALSTFQEYLLDYATPATRQVGEKLIEQKLQEMEAPVRQVAAHLLERVRGSQRDVYV